MKGSAPAQRSLVRHRQIHSPPASISAKAPIAMPGNSATAPGAWPAVWAIHSSASIALPVAHQNGAPAPTRSKISASNSSGITRKVVIGIAMMLASAP